MGGSDDPSNLISVNITLHAFLHKILYEQYGHWEDLVAWKTLSGQINNAEINNVIRRERMIGNTIWTGRKHSAETITKMSSVKKGKKFSDNHKRALSEAWKTRPPISEQTRQKLSKPRFNRRKKFEIIHPDGRVEIIEGIYEFGKKYGIHGANLLKVANGQRKHTQGYVCKRIEE
jgi:hypothetical protein